MRDTTLLILTDGRNYLAETLASLEENVDEHWGDVIVVDDSTNPEYTNWLMTHPYLTRIGARVRSAPRKRGFAGAIRTGWRLVNPAFPFVFHMEDDFTFNRPLDLAPLKSTLTVRPELMQLALRRQPVSVEEAAAGGIIERFPDRYEEIDDVHGEWLAHREFFTTNPCLYGSWLCETGWPEPPDSERVFSDTVFKVPQAVCGFWGPRSSTPWVSHIGHVREGTGY